MRRGFAPVARRGFSTPTNVSFARHVDAPFIHFSEADRCEDA